MRQYVVGLPDYTELHSLSAKERLNQNLLLTPKAKRQASLLQTIVTSLIQNKENKCIVGQIADDINLFIATAEPIN